MKYTSKQGDTFDSICWNVFGKVEGVLEKVLELNPQELKEKIEIPEGKEIELPDEPQEEIKEIVRLFS